MDFQEDLTVSGDTLDKSGKVKPVCTFCKRRKIKCDRGIPCSSCIRFNNKECVYVDPNPKSIKKKASKPSKKTLESEIEILKERIGELQKSIVNDRGDVVGETSPNGKPPLASYSLDHATEARYENDFDELMQLVEEHSWNESFNLLNQGSVVFDHEPLGRKNFGFFSWKACYVVDPALKYMGAYAKRLHQEGKGFYGSNDLSEANTRRINGFFSYNVEPLVHKNETCVLPNCHLCSGSNSMEVEEPPQKVNRSSSILNPINVLNNKAETKFSELFELQRKIELFLPSKRIILTFLNRFFKTLYTFMPVIDESDFKSQVCRLLEGTELDERPVSLRIKTKLDFAYLGILLLLLRLSYLALLPMNQWTKSAIKDHYMEEEIEEVRMLLNHNIGLDAARLSQDCVGVFNLCGVINLTIFQLVLVTRTYSIFAPEKGDGPEQGEAQILNTTLFQMAYGLGIHREPNNTTVFQDEKSKNLIRKMWSMLLMLDLNHSLEYGDPLNVSRFSYDTLYPTFRKENSNLIDLNREKFVVECYQFMEICYKPLIGFISELLDVNATYNVTTLCKKLRYLRATLFNPQDGLITSWVRKFDASQETNTMLNLTKYKIQLQFSHFICTLYFHLYNYFEKKKLFEVAFYYLFNLMNKVLLVLFPFYFELVNLKSVEPTIDFVLVPGIQSLLHKATLFLLSLMVRIKINIIASMDAPNHMLLFRSDMQYRRNFDSLCSLFHKLLEISSCLTSIADAYSKKYYYSWMISRVNKFFLSLIKSPDFREIVYNGSASFPIFADFEKVDKLQELLNLCLETKAKLSSSNPNIDKSYTRNDADLFDSSLVNPYKETDISPFNDTNYSSTVSSNFEKESMDRTTNDGRNTMSSDMGDNGIPSEEVDNIWLQLLGVRDGSVNEAEDFLGHDIPQTSFSYPEATRVPPEMSKQMGNMNIQSPNFNFEQSPFLGANGELTQKSVVDAFLIDELFGDFS
ncbi:hypothetical protein PSN45_004064 [Yamadazyma tenuis]|uniref:Zn(2)-C6 fungal-type domain-containing protein n=1 Tax=Candida tenuis (strain ATCC 10573 / BCRC 21748 / CBS 615 / JCM 9827 / NBRC 10315 / NRRL Y-1498 / VKM Y-70) TaxID=590646 RepID=G3B4S7_CANTC|nr:uncharacterized protein CANTEDRAFT_93366 [Yamadazyma tenuis ATCC 10573]EGV63863.1 hypothetical protein CANTEDRAFT_93366 [Yamadazyma tenuis ATCC 10573]WEJ96525.1 hypothetical protein PSN45_004064 [Yamadazyma tenuis]